MSAGRLVVLLALLPLFSLSAAAQSALQPGFVGRYCVTCHSQRLKTGGLVLENVGVEDPTQHADIWEKVILKLRVGAMPPPGAPQPQKPERDAFRKQLESALDTAYEAKPNPGRVGIHRINRAEYANAIRDLFDVQVDVESLLPADSSSYGFDNNADTLTVSPLLLEKYFSAAVKIAESAVGNPKAKPLSTVFPIRFDHSQNQRQEGMPLGTRGGILVNYNFPADGTYHLKAQLYKGVDSPDRGIQGRDTPQTFEILVDGVRVFLTHFGGMEDDAASYKNFSDMNWKVSARMQVRVPIKAGPHQIAFTFLEQTTAGAQSLFQMEPRTSLMGSEGGGLGQLESATITGPFEPTGVSETPSRRKIFVCSPQAIAAAKSSAAKKPSPGDISCATRILENLARRAYRRPLAAGDLEASLSLYQEARNDGGDFYAGIRAAIPVILTSPSFLFRMEADPQNISSPHRVSDLELASRLAFFLWSSIPDDELLTLAAGGKLKEPVFLEKQVRRMLADRRSHEMVVNFAGQWLALRNLPAVTPNTYQFRNFDDILRQGFRTETEMLFESIMRDDRSVLALLNADYTFVNERLAKHYGIPGVYGEEFRRVPVTDENRRGLLGQSSILTLTSTQIRTSPVKRGKWILTNLLNSPPPAPPANVPPLAENKPGSKPLSVRERLEEHRKNPTCASCHRSIDPLGFALENFDAIGQWRETTEAGTAVDALGSLPDGTVIRGAADLRKALTSNPEIFVNTFIERLMTYALGRGVEYYDAPAVRSVYREAETKNFSFSSIVLGIVKSVPFQMRAKPSESPQTAVVVSPK